MPNTPNASFIPKQGPAKHSRYVASRQLHILTSVSYVLFVATLIASSGLFFYTPYVQKKLDTEVVALNEAIAGFSQSDMDQVREFNRRLEQASQRLNTSVSLNKLFSALETATAQSVQITEFDLVRNGDVDYTLSAKLRTDSFDSSLFQRSVYEGSAIMNSVTVSDLAIEAPTEDGEGGVSFIAKVGIPISTLPYEVSDSVTADVVSASSSTIVTASSSDSQLEIN